MVPAVLTLTVFVLSARLRVMIMRETVTRHRRLCVFYVLGARDSPSS